MTERRIASHRFGTLALLLLLSRALSAAETQIGSLSDLDFGRVPPTATRLEARTDFCVAVDPRGRYTITAAGDGPGGRFSLQSDGGFGPAGLAYRVEVRDRGRGPGQSLEPGVPLSGLRGQAPRPSGPCRQPFGTIRVIIDAATLSAARPGRYRGTLALTVAPE